MYFDIEKFFNGEVEEINKHAKVLCIFFIIETQIIYSLNIDRRRNKKVLYKWRLYWIKMSSSLVKERLRRIKEICKDSCWLG